MRLLTGRGAVLHGRQVRGRGALDAKLAVVRLPCARPTEKPSKVAIRKIQATAFHKCAKNVH